MAFKPIQDEHDEAEDKIKQVKDITAETKNTTENYDKTAKEEIDQAIEELAGKIDMAELGTVINLFEP